MARKYWADAGKKDSDGDGLSDEFEKNVLGTDPRKQDSDGDGLNDLRELDFGANPMDPDTDHDGVNDYREVIVGIDPASADTDHDGIGDAVELRRGTAFSPDSNGDGTPDWVESARSQHTSDTDGLSDAEERWLRTDPDRLNTDGDRVPDDEEVIMGMDPRTPAPSSGAVSADDPGTFEMPSPSTTADDSSGFGSMAYDDAVQADPGDFSIDDGAGDELAVPDASASDEEWDDALA